MTGSAHTLQLSLSLLSELCRARLALSRSRRCHSLCALYSAVSAARRTLSRSLLRRSLSSLFRDDSEHLVASMLVASKWPSRRRLTWPAGPAQFVTCAWHVEKLNYERKIRAYIELWHDVRVRRTIDNNNHNHNNIAHPRSRCTINMGLTQARPNNYVNTKELGIM